MTSKHGLVRDLVKAVSQVPARVMLLPVRIQMGTFKHAPIKTVLLIDMAQQNWLPREQSLSLAYQCKAILVRYGIFNVEVEVRAVPWRLWSRTANSAPTQSDSAGSAESNHHEQAHLPPARIFPLLKKRHLACVEFLEAYSTQLDPYVELVADQALGYVSFTSDLDRGLGTTGQQISTFKSRGTLGLILRLL